MSKAEELRAKARQLAKRRVTVTYEGFVIDVVEPSYALVASLTGKSNEDAAFALVQSCAKVPGTDECVWSEVSDELRALPLGLVRAMSEAASSFISDENRKAAEANPT